MKNEYEAQGFHSSFGGLTASGTIRIGERELVFSSNLGSFSLPIQGLQARVGGYNSQVFLEHPEFPGCSVTPQDPSICQHPVFALNPGFTSRFKQAGKVPSGGRWLFGAAAVLLGLLVAILGLLFLKRAALVRLVANQIPQALEVKMGDAMFAQVKADEKLVDDPVLAAVLQDISSRLLPSVKDAGYPFQFHVVSDTNINAFAIPGGHVVVFTGLLKAARTSEEVAGVLAHEIAHVTQKHSFRTVIQSAGLFLAVQALFGDASGLLAVVGDSSRFLLQQKFSRDFEREADEVGWGYLAAARINPRGMIDFFKILQAEEDKTGVSLPGLLNTHPATAERIRRLEGKLAQSKEVGSYLALKPLPAKR